MLACLHLQPQLKLPAEMNIILRVLHPLFSWGFLIFFGLESIERQLYPLSVNVAVGLGGLSQTYWRSMNSHGRRPYLIGDLISFGIGLLAALSFPILMLWSFLTNSFAR